ncbi:MAG: RHS repeat-associated core domain-containing protein, partial [Anaerolineae bacterium]
SYEYDAADRLTSVNGVGYTWDDNGNLLSDGTRTYSYDAADRLVGVSGGGVNASYTYNGDGLRVGQTIDGQGMTFTWDVAAALPQVLATSNGAAYVHGLSLLAQQQAGAWQYPLPDGLGSVRHLTDPLGQVVQSYNFSPFGVPLGASGGDPYGFTGEHWDAATGLLYLRARWYDPATGRFLTRDPFPGLAMLPTTQHPYVYVGNNPVNLVDPSGNIAPILLAIGVGAAIGGVGGGVGYALAHPGGRPEDYLRSRDFWRAAGVGAASGAVAGAVGFAVGGLVAGLPGLGGAVLGGALTGAAASGTGQVTANLLTPCVKWHSGLSQVMLFGGVTGGIAGGVGYGIRWLSSSRGARPPWLSWEQYEKVTIDGKVYAKVGTRLYTQHAVERTYPSGLGRAARPGGVPGRSVAPAFVEDVLTSPLASRTPVTGPHGEVRISHVLGTLEVITEGDIVITIITH